MRWDDIVSRVFGRIDPIALGGENYRRSSPNVEVFDSHTRFGPTLPDGRYLLRTDDGDEFTADQVVIAAGSRAVIPTAIADCGVRYHTSDTIMRIADVPEHLVIVGGGFVACEFAHVFSALGSRVTLVIRGSTLLRGLRRRHLRALHRYRLASKWEVRSHHKVTGAPAGRRLRRITLQLDDGSHGARRRAAGGDRPDPQRRPARRANRPASRSATSGQVVVDEYQRTTARGIFALGDVSSDYQLKHVANHEARVVKHNLLQDWDDTDALMPSDHRYVPSAVFTDPQIASVGLTENEARAKGFNIKVKIQDFGDVAYGWAMEDTTGIAKIIVDDDTGLILGAHIMGHQASSLIQPLIQAMSFGLTGTGHGARPVLDPPRAAGGRRERVAGVVRRAAVAAVASDTDGSPDGCGAQRSSTCPKRQTARAINQAATKIPTIMNPTNSRSNDPIDGQRTRVDAETVGERGLRAR